MANNILEKDIILYSSAMLFSNHLTQIKLPLIRKRYLRTMKVFKPFQATFYEIFCNLGSFCECFIFHSTACNLFNCYFNFMLALFGNKHKFFRKFGQVRSFLSSILKLRHIRQIRHRRGNRLKRYMK